MTGINRFSEALGQVKNSDPSFEDAKLAAQLRCSAVTAASGNEGSQVDQR